MAQPFVLRLTDGVEEVNFLGGNYRVMDGGFDISLPRVERQFGMLYPGFYAPTEVEVGWRESKLRFEVLGSTRSEAIAALQKIERIIAHVHRRVRQSGARHAELSYAFEGAENITYFEVLGGDIAFAQDILSLAKVHYRDSDNKYHIEDIELTLYLSGYGYGGSILGALEGSAWNVPLKNDSTAKTTSGVTIKNIGTGQLNWVEIEAVDLPGSSPYITRIEIQPVTNSLASDLIYIGHTIFDDTGVLYDTDYAGFNDLGATGSSNVNAQANNGQYFSKNFNAGYYTANDPEFWWNISTWTKGGLYMAFLHCWTSQAQGDGLQFALGAGNTWLIENSGKIAHQDWVVPRIDHMTVPLGVVQIPVMGLDINRLGDARQGNNASIGIWVAAPSDQATTLAFDYLSLMPIDNGLRLWRNLGGYTWTTSDILIDDGLRGETYHDPSNTGYLAERSFVGMLDPIKLIPNTNNRLYFTTIGTEAASTERNRQIKVIVRAMPTFLTLAY